jgi:hypothetical protein
LNPGKERAGSGDVCEVRSLTPVDCSKTKTTPFDL